MVIKDCIFAMDEMFRFRVIELGFPPKDFPMSSREIMSDLLGDDPEFVTPDTVEDVGLYYADLKITHSKSSWESTYDDDVDYEVENIRPLEVCLKNRSRKNLLRLLVQKFKSTREFLKEKVAPSKVS